jgi:hypothetical protein
MAYAFEFAAKSGLDGAYMEFGCFEGASFINAHHAYAHWLARAAEAGWPMSRRKMYAFDSFEGLPELSEADRQPGYSVFARGQYCCSRERFVANLLRAGVDMKTVQIVPGFYQDSLTAELRETIRPVRAMVVHIDCDLYSSAKDALEFLAPLVGDGTVMLFDDYYCHRGNPSFGVRRAVDEWATRERIVMSPYFSYSWAGRAFIATPRGAS